MNRPVAVAAASMDAVKAAHARVIHEMNERRGILFFAAAWAAGLAEAALGGVAGGDFAGAGSGESSLLIGISQWINELKLFRCFQ